MSKVVQIGDTFIYYNDWHTLCGCKYPTVIGCDWIYTDKELATFQKWHDKKGKK